MARRTKELPTGMLTRRWWWKIVGSTLSSSLTLSLILPFFSPSNVLQNGLPVYESVAQKKCTMKKEEVGWWTSLRLKMFILVWSSGRPHIVQIVERHESVMSNSTCKKNGHQIKACIIPKNKENMRKRKEKKKAHDKISCKTTIPSFKKMIELEASLKMV